MYLPKPVVTKVSLNWEDDLELYSRFLDRKVKFIANINFEFRKPLLSL